MTKPRPDLDPPLAGSAGPLSPDDALPPLDDEGGDGRMRQCCVTRARLPAADMIRFVRSPDGVVTPDINAKLPGRGVWVTGHQETLETARLKGHFPRAFRGKATVPDDLVAATEALLKARCLALIGFARKAGDAVAGHDQVCEALDQRRPGLLLQARDGAIEGRDKILARAEAQHGRAAFGRDHIVHALIRRGAMASAIKAVYERLARFRNPAQPTPPDGFLPDPET
jgi:uncharacterized protein